MKPIDKKPELFKLGGKLGLRDISKIEQCLIFRQKEFLQNRASESGSQGRCHLNTAKTTSTAATASRSTSTTTASRATTTATPSTVETTTTHS